MENWTVIAKYISSEANDHEKKQVELWLGENPSHIKLTNMLQKVVRPELPYPDFKLHQEDDWQKLQNQIIDVPAKKTAVPLFTPLRIAASILFIALLLSVMWYATNRYDGYKQEFQSGPTIYSSVLPDGTKAWLNKNSRLQISDHFGKTERRVILKGEAYFEVARDSTRPFLVLSDDLITKVKGTAFNVNTPTGKSIIVTVREGKVIVYRKGDENSGEILMKDQMIHYTPSSKLLEKNENTDLNFLSWKTRVIRFQAEPLWKVCRFLSVFYNQQIQLKGSSLRELTITTTLDHTDLYRSLEIISSTLNLSIEKTGNTFYLVLQK